jgi:hypothetical protein
VCNKGIVVVLQALDFVDKLLEETSICDADWARPALDQYAKELHSTYSAMALKAIGMLSLQFAQ